MTNPNNAIGTNAAYGTRTSVNAFNDICQIVGSRGILKGWQCSPKSGMVVQLGGVAGTRDVAIAEDNLGNRTTINNRLGEPIEVEIGAASSSSNRYDAIVAYVKNPAQATSATPIPQDAPSVCGLITVQGSSGGVSEAQIRTAITSDGGGGTTAYYVVLATVYIASGTTTITSSNISQSPATPVYDAYYEGGTSSTPMSHTIDVAGKYFCYFAGNMMNDSNEWNQWPRQGIAVNGSRKIHSAPSLAAQEQKPFNVMTLLDLAEGDVLSAVVDYTSGGSCRIFEGSHLVAIYIGK